MKRTPIIEIDGTRKGIAGELKDIANRIARNEKYWVEPLRLEPLHCSFCKGHLGAVEYDRVLDVEYRTCLKCGHQ